MTKNPTYEARKHRSPGRTVFLLGASALVLLICGGIGICGAIGVFGVISTPVFRATASPSLSVARITPIETPTTQRPLPSLTPLPGQVGVRPSQTAYALTRTAYPTDIVFNTPILLPTKLILIWDEGTATKFIKTLEPLLTRAATHPANTTGLCNDGTYLYTEEKPGACSQHGGMYDWWGPRK